MSPNKKIRNATSVISDIRDFGDKLSDGFVNMIGTWTFITIQTTLIIIWIFLNVLAYVNHWDPYPFILLNLGLSLQAAYAGPIIMMSQNRMNEKDRIRDEVDFEINARSAEEIEEIQLYLKRIEDKKLSQIQKDIELIKEKIGAK